jgi:hypothetical protein
MRLVPINAAEAILEPFWDGGSSEHPTDKLSMLDDYIVTVPGNVRGGVAQTWCAVQVSFEHASPDSAPITMERTCDIALNGYDVIRIFASLPDWVTLTLTATLDGRPHVLIDRVPGANTNDEHDGALPTGARRMTALSLAFALTEPRPASLSVLWIGLSNAAKQAEMEAQTSPYTADWPGLLRPAEEAKTRPTAFLPEIGILFGAGDLPALRANVHSDLLRDEYEALRTQAERDLTLSPETDIGEFIAKPDRRWVRNRDMNKVQTAGIMERLAFVGLIEEDARLSRMAARMALSAAHCDTWCESILGAFPGATWHHRSFTEEIYARACGLVLDWAGFCLTPAAQQIIRDAIVMKGLPRIESDFKRMEYIRHMNQGIVFSSGRIFGILSLLPAYPRYAALIEEAERDLHEMIGNYVHPDGGTLEGMSYWNYTFSQVMPTLLALARFHDQSLMAYGRQYPLILRTGDYGLGMLSILHDGTTYLPVNDAHADITYASGLVAAYAQLSEDPQWRALYRALAETRTSQGGGDLYHLIMAPSPDELRAAPSRLRERFGVFPDVGEASSVRTVKPGNALLAGARTHFHLSSGPTYGGHYHEDKGAFILEVAGVPGHHPDSEALIYDRGVTHYHHPEVALIGMAARHNLVYPERADGALVRQPHATAGGDPRGGTLTHASQEGDLLRLSCDSRDAWPEGEFLTNHRHVISPAADLFIIVDDLMLAEPRSLVFLVNSPFNISVHGATLLIEGRATHALVEPLTWTPARVEAGVDGVDCHLDPAHLGRLATASTYGTRLFTAIHVLPAGVRIPSWELTAADTNGCTLGHADGRRTITVNLNHTGELLIHP